MKKKKLFTAITIIGLTALLAGCTDEKEPTDSDLRSAWQQKLDLGAKNAEENVTKQQGSTIKSLTKESCVKGDNSVWACNFKLVQVKPDHITEDSFDMKNLKFKKESGKWIAIEP